MGGSRLGLAALRPRRGALQILRNTRARRDESRTLESTLRTLRVLTDGDMAWLWTEAAKPCLYVIGVRGPKAKFEDWDSYLP